ncbi:MAG: cofactor-independent phosphoglycerate mutase [Deltaproteobacteria bacterium]
MKYVILVGDGMGDLPIAELGNKTPLEAAATPAMDTLAKRGVLYSVATVPSGMPPGSDVANLSLLGYLPAKIYSGRAPLEAASMGVSLAADEVAFRCNLVTLAQQAGGSLTMVDYSAGHISTAEAADLIEALNRSCATDRIRFYPGVGYRHLMVHKGLLPELETVPPHDYSGQDVTHFWQRYLKIDHFKKLLSQAQTVLADHPVNLKRQQEGKNPANAIWLWGEGKSPVMPSFYDQYAKSGALISAVDLLKGIAVLAGLDVLPVEGATGYLDTNYQGKVDAALAALQEHDMVFVHVEAPDEAAHQGLLAEKMQAIEDFDRKIVKPVFEALQASSEPFRIIVAMDHYTPLAIRTHDRRPVPILLYDSRWKKEHPQLRYTEAAAACYGNYLANGREMMELFLGHD